MLPESEYTGIFVLIPFFCCSSFSPLLWADWLGERIGLPFTFFYFMFCSFAFGLFPVWVLFRTCWLGVCG
ncbi:hypothetical protein GGI42DRAFT_335854 [Trichoderma sp. SZMC 28013]